MMIVRNILLNIGTNISNITELVKVTIKLLVSVFKNSFNIILLVNKYGIL